MQKVLTVIFRDIEDTSDVSLRSIPEQNDHVVIGTDSGKVVVKISELEEALKEVKEFNGEPEVQTG